MPILNSVHLWGRYKQKFPDNIDNITLIHTAPNFGQVYQKDFKYRNIQWIFGSNSIDRAIN